MRGRIKPEQLQRRLKKNKLAKDQPPTSVLKETRYTEDLGNHLPIRDLQKNEKAEDQLVNKKMGPVYQQTPYQNGNLSCYGEGFLRPL